MREAINKIAKIHIVDDDESVAESLSILLRDFGLDASTYASADEFLERAWPLAPASCLILDIHMPKIGGIELARRLLRDGSQVPIIFITGRVDLQLRAQTDQIGCVALLENPVDESDLRRALLSAAERCGPRSSS